jgi:Arc/MetJ-type ribon-helix-helix transcriptional regulator
METHRSNTNMSRKKKVSFRISEKDLQEIDYQIGQSKFRDRSDFFTSATTELLGKIALEGKHQ